jgi:hypothetical protein
VEIVLGTVVVNAHFLYKKTRNEHVSITRSMENIVKRLLNHKNIEENNSERSI